MDKVSMWRQATGAVVIAAMFSGVALAGDQSKSGASGMGMEKGGSHAQAEEQSSRRHSEKKPGHEGRQNASENHKHNKNKGQNEHRAMGDAQRSDRGDSKNEKHQSIPAAQEKGKPAPVTQDNRANDSAHNKVGICHATGSETNPYVFISVSENAVKAHQNHQNHEDLIGVTSEADCPSGHDNGNNGGGNGNNDGGQGGGSINQPDKKDTLSTGSRGGGTLVQAAAAPSEESSGIGGGLLPETGAGLLSLILAGGISWLVSRRKKQLQLPL